LFRNLVPSPLLNIDIVYAMGISRKIKSTVHMSRYHCVLSGRGGVVIVSKVREASGNKSHASIRNTHQRAHLIIPTIFNFPRTDHSGRPISITHCVLK
jgi:hypothetical protein